MLNVRNFRLLIGALTSIFLLSAVALGWGASPSRAVSVPTPTYVGKWSNGRGDTLAITATTIRFANDKPVKYRDVTKVTNGSEFHLEITSEEKLNYLTKFLSLSMGEGEKPAEMKMTLYDSYKDMVDGANSQGEATWYRDK
jgi:hypothetical protein